CLYRMSHEGDDGDRGARQKWKRDCELRAMWPYSLRHGVGTLEMTKYECAGMTKDEGMTKARSSFCPPTGFVCRDQFATQRMWPNCSRFSVIPSGAEESLTN